MAGLFSLKKPYKKIGAVIDIASRSIGGGLFEVTSGGQVKLLYTAREAISFQRELSGEALMSAMSKSLDAVLLHLEKYGLKHLQNKRGMPHIVDKINVTISAPWHASEVKVLRESFEKSTVISTSKIAGMLEAEDQSFEKRMVSDGKNVQGFVPVERKIVEVRLNGYPTGSPFGKVAKDVEVRFFESIASPEVLNIIKTSIDKHFSIEDVKVHSFSLTAFSSIRDLFPAINDFLIVQIDGEITDVTIVKNNSIVEMVSFPLGHNSLLRTLGTICVNHPNCTLESLLVLHKEKGISGIDKVKVDSAIEATRKGWLSYFNSAISGFSEEMFLPRTLFLFEDLPHTSLFEDFLRQAESSQFTITGETFIIKKIFNESLSESSKLQDNSILNEPMLFMEADFSCRFTDN
ncbi:MAG: hypothetical protein EXS59_01325 [Candidatus Taylorbacteria bacterium]|nr:hypothetical protein [Candidatus Taylorbacteria bacterium]